MSTEEKEGKARNEEIENQLKRDRMQQRNEIKMLLLGTSGNASAAVPIARARQLARGTAGSPSRTRVISNTLSLAQVLVNPESRPS